MLQFYAGETYKITVNELSIIVKAALAWLQECLFNLWKPLYFSVSVLQIGLL